MALDLTHGSAMEYETIIYGNMTPEMAAEYLRGERISIRSFSDTLRKMYPCDDIQKKLKQFFRNILVDGKRSSMDRKIQNWMSGQNQPTNREDYFRIAFALELTEAQLNFLLGMCTDYTIQYRDGREAVLAWFLRNGYGYQEAVDFLCELAEAEDIKSSVTAGGSAFDADGYTEVSRITHEIREEFRMVRTKEELRECYLRNLNRFGRLHLRSYYYFRQYLKQLIQPVSAAGESEMDYSIETVMDTYLTLQMPMGKKRSHYSLVQKLIKQNWPNTTSVRNIRNQLEDVPRKLLLLLYVVTENSDNKGDYSEFDEDYISLEERVEDHWWTLNAMLADSGMAAMDLRNAFDWLILYAVSTNGEESMSGRLERVINELFRDADERAKELETAGI